ncbi:MAG TPA: hypothetical protein VH020_09295 [Stellaceae bacterium]|jgi:hypothetical protein|nr:hypothetical protein [Stellaceae bacterium]
MEMSKLVPPCVYPLPAFDGPTVVFGADRKAYLSREQLGDWYGLYGENSKTPFHHAAAQLFYKGGKLTDYGLKVKPDLDSGKVRAAVQALLGSFAPKHEIKIGTVAVALANWRDYAAPTTEAAAE